MSNYPSSIFSPRERENRSGIMYEPLKKSVIFVEDINLGDDEVVAIEETLGLNPQGGYSTVAERLDNMGGGGGGIYTNIIFVDKNGNDTSGDGSSGNPYLTIGKALAIANDGDVIDIGVGEWKEDIIISGEYISLRGKGIFNTKIKGQTTIASGSSDINMYFLTLTSSFEEATTTLILESDSMVVLLNCQLETSDFAEDILVDVGSGGVLGLFNTIAGYMNDGDQLINMGSDSQLLSFWSMLKTINLPSDSAFMNFSNAWDRDSSTIDGYEMKLGMLEDLDLNHTRDMINSNENAGYVLKDRTTSDYYRLKVDNGVLGVELVT